jgi:hypothetical protein
MGMEGKEFILDPGIDLRKSAFEMEPHVSKDLPIEGKRSRVEARCLKIILNQRFPWLYS